MEKISKIISLEPFITRFPLTYPSLKDGEVIYINQSTLKGFPNANYGLIPLGVNENICGSYLNFTQEMYETYGGKTIYYSTLQKWYVEFKKFYGTIHGSGCKTPYSSATQYCKAKYDITSGAEYEYYESLDEEHKKRGGDKFYSWLTENYFICADMKYLYKQASESGVSISMSYAQWVDCVDNLKKEYIYFPDACELLREMKSWKIEYEDKDCKELDDCCECVKYKKFGSDDMIKILEFWINNTDGKISEINDKVKNEDLSTLIDSVNLKASTKQKVADFGNYTMFCKEYSPTTDYIVSGVCMYENEIYFLKSLPAHNYNRTSQRNEINLWTEDSQNGWYPFIKQYRYDDEMDTGKACHEFITLTDDYILSGRTISSLDEFLWSRDTVDNLGNILPGHFEAYSGSTFVQPAEGTYLNLEYQIGKANNIEVLDDGKFTGDILTGIILFLNDENGNLLSATTISCTEGDDIPSKIDECIAKGIQLESESISVDYTINADFIYYKNTEFSYNSKGNFVLTKAPNSNINYGIKYVEHCTLQKMVASYYLSSTELYPINYYKVVRDVEENDSEYTDEKTYVKMSDFIFVPSIYTNNSTNNNTVAGPIFRREELLGITGPEKVTDTIYIDRGYATILDQRLRIGDITSFESLEKYGNGSFNIINSQEQII